MNAVRLLLPGLCLLAAAASAGGPVIAPPVINLQPRGPVLDQQCVDRLKGSGANTARAAHECRKARQPGTPPPAGAQAGTQASTPSSQTEPAAKP